MAAASELRAALLSAVSHDLRTPIAAVKASVTSLLQRDVDWTPEAQREFLETIDEETDRLNALVGNLLDMSRLQAGALEIMTAPVGLEEVLPAALRSLGVRDGAVALDVSESLPRVLADPGLLERALANVIENAMRYSPAGCAGASHRRGRERHRRRADRRIADRASLARSRQRLFQPFQRLGERRPGPSTRASGWGSPFAGGFAEAMDAEITIDDTPGGGGDRCGQLEDRAP